MKTRFLYLIGLLVGVTLDSAASIVDTSFNPGTGAGGGIVEKALPQPDGKILVCGNFTSFNGQNRGYVARLNADGSVDTGFLAQPGYWVRTMALQSDGKIVIGGYFTTVQGVPRNLVARLNSDGSLDTSFDPGTGAHDAIAGGIDGNNDPFVFWVAVQPDGKIVITGNFRNYNGSESMGIARLNSDGSRDTTFNVGSGLDSWGRHILLLPIGQLLVSGWFTGYNGKSSNRMVRINADGSPDGSFNPNFGDRTAIYSSALTADGKIIATGHSLNYDGLFREEMRRLNWDGSADTTFTASTNEKTESVLVQSDGKVIVGGNFSRAGGTPRASLARFNADGSLDPDFHADIDNFVWGISFQADGKLLVTGGFYTVDGYPRVGVARVLTGASAGNGGGTPPPPEQAPSLSVGSATTNSLTLSWSDSSNSRSGYAIERKNGTVFSQVGTAGGTAHNFTVSGLAPAAQYTFRIRANNNDGSSIYSNEASGTTAAVPPPTGGGGSASASFVTTDSSTKGSWKGVYGADGYSVFNDAATLPGYARVSAAGKTDWIWQWATQESAALQRANGSDRIAGCWFSNTSFTMDLTFTDASAHRVAVYFLDWDMLGRTEMVQVTDGDSGAVLDSRSLSSFGGGVYLVWNLKGHVKITVVANSGNAVASGLFFGGAGTVQQSVATPMITPAGGSFSSAQSVTLSTSTAGGGIRYTLDGSEPGTSSALYSGPITLNSSATLKAKGFASGLLPSGTASATFTIGGGGGGGGTTTANKVAFVGTDTTTKGTWRGVYGKEGHMIHGKSAVYPAYAQVSAAGKQDWVWKDVTIDTRALQFPDDARKRIASGWYGDTFTVDFNFADGRTHRVSIYFLDWDAGGRSQKVEVLDGTSGAVLWTQELSDFSEGKYLTWDMKGMLKLRFTKVSGSNAILNGLFFQAAPGEI